MNEKIHIRRTTAPVKTPRITSQSSNGHISPNQHVPFVTQQKNILPILPSFDTSKIISINHNFHILTDNVAYFLSHNGCVGSYRSQVSQQTTDLERLFNSFYQAILKYSSQQNYKNNPTVRSTGISFLKNWQLFALSIIELRKVGPGMISQSINAHFNSINTSLKTVMNNGISKSNVHDQSYRNGRILQNQLNALKSSSDFFLEKSSGSEELKSLSSEMKDFSRSLNDTFSREFSQCGIAQNEVVRLRSKCYTACCDVIHGLRNSFLFQTNISKLFQLLNSFQNNLKELLEKLNLPLNYLVQIEFDSSSISDAQNLEEEEEEKEEEEVQVSFDENLSLPDFIRDSQGKSKLFIKNQQSGDKFFGILNTKVIGMVSEFSKKKMEESKNQKAVKDEFERLKRENKLLMQERKVFMDEADELKIECEDLKKSVSSLKCEIENNNEKYLKRVEKLKNSLKKISKIDREIDDDELISEATKIQNETFADLERLKQNELRLSNLLNSSDIVSETERILNELSSFQRKSVEVSRESDSILQMKEKERKLKQIFNQFSKLDSTIDVANEIFDSFKKLKHIVSCSSLSEGVDSIYMIFSDVNEALIRISNTKKSGDNQINLLNLVSKVENDIINAQNILEKSVESRQNDLPISTESLIETAENISNTHLRYLKSFTSILSILNHQKFESDRAADLEAVEAVQRVSKENKEIIQKLKQIARYSNNSQLPQSNLSQSLFDSVEKKMIHDKETIIEMSKFCVEVEAALFSYVNNEAPNSKQFSFNSSTMKTVRALLKKLPPKENRNNGEIEFKAFLKNVELKLCKIVNQECNKEASYQNHIISLIDILGAKIQKDNLLINSISSKLGLSNGSENEILRKIDSIISNNHSKSEENKSIEQMFQPIFDLVPVTSRSDPSQYIPEFCNAFISLHNSIISLKPFATILNTIFGQFDCKLQSFKPSTQPFQFIKGQIYNLHTALNNLSPSKVNSLVFLILSRFVALTSSFTAAISSASFDDGDPNMKEEFFKMQIQICKTQKMI